MRVTYTWKGGVGLVGGSTELSKCRGEGYGSPIHGKGGGGG